MVPDNMATGGTTETNEFYSGLAPLYHLIYEDWDRSVERQANVLSSVIRDRWGDVGSVLDVSCGIGTQALGLAKLGYDVTASDLCTEEVARAEREAEARGLAIKFSVADMRQAYEAHASTFDVVISCDNSVPHLLSDDDIRTTFRQLHKCTRPGGGCIISVRDYEKEDLSEPTVKPYGMREYDGARWLVWQVWEPHPPMYDAALYIVEDRGGSECKAHVMRTKYYAIGIARLIEMLKEAGFSQIERLDGKFFQPIVVGTNARH